MGEERNCREGKHTTPAVPDHLPGTEEFEAQCMVKIPKRFSVLCEPSQWTLLSNEAILFRCHPGRTWKQGQATKEEYNQIARNCRNGIRKAKTENELGIAKDAKHNKKAFFRYIQNKRHEKGVQLLKVDGRVMTDDKEKAEVLNSYFALVFSHKEICTQEEVQAGSERWQPKIDRQMVKEYLDGINTLKSMGPDELYPRVIKELAEELSEPWAIIFDKSWKTGEVPDDWRRGNVVPIFKKGKKDEPGNYRPVSLTSIPGKILEKIIKKLICKHLEENAVINRSQHGFIKNPVRLI
ncbi:hypothetical protein EYD10_14280 [Varanus komodoensis]|nr:hypothetical protein EYD10_14280 [Varanus komodoensis]